jgi:hypothetical protein
VNVFIAGIYDPGKKKGASWLGTFVAGAGGLLKAGFTVRASGATTALVRFPRYSM